MNIWHPAPRGLINSAATERWTRKRPAPEIVVYLWIWSQRDECAPPTRRQVATVFGWTEHQARKMIVRVKDDMNEWRLYTSPRAQKGRRPPDASNDANLRERGARIPPTNHHDSPDHTGASTQHSQHTTETERPCLEDMKEWQALT
jgi:hypothetical protein